MSPTAEPKPPSPLTQLLTPSFFKALSDPNRISILGWLAQGRAECTVGEVAEWLPVDPSVVSRHLAILRDAGLLEASKRGRQVFYRVRITELAGTLRRIADALETCCTPLLSDDGAPGDRAEAG